MKGILVGYKPYDFNTDKGENIKGFTLFFNLEGVLDIEGKGCLAQKVPFNNNEKKYAYGFDSNSISLGAPYELEYGTGLDKDMKPVSKLLKITRVK